MSSGNKFLTYAAPAIKRAMSDLIRQYSQDAIWRLKCDKANTWKIVYLADCDGKWGELSYNFKDDTAEILLLAEWDTVVSHRFALRVIEYLRIHCTKKLPDEIVLTFIGPEQM